ncbi:TlpA disulfide reductase family protein [Pontibacter sp. G13]|uniref:TlpA family protein disulfide reductase n=1 Tax=Pontibacter sp. G13 TaxID=3074898 RepID=UPI00288C3A92|nr:TlpA disulfide reductase family protein [Pontibacter sp. G13]WNJ17814.1 TlpA disulfide reductase family protein [Pontibacter sp. G13]
MLIRTLSILGLLMAFLSTHAQESIHVIGRIDSAYSTEIRFIPQLDFVQYKNDTITVPIQEDGSFEVSLPLTGYTLFRTLLSREYVNLRGFPGDTVQVYLSEQHVDESYTVTGDNRTAALAAYRKGYEAYFAQLAPREAQIQHYRDDEAMEFKAYSDSIQDQKWAYFQAHKDSLPEEYIHYFESTFPYSRQMMSLNYLFNHKALHNFQGDFPMPPEAFFADMRELPLTGLESPLNESVYDFAEKFISNIPETFGSSLKKIEYIQANTDGELREALMFSRLRSTFDMQDLTEFLPHIEAFLASDAKESYRKEIQEDHDKYLRFMPGKALPDFELLDLDGKPVKLSDFRGQWVSLEFWASWCGPCRVQAPHIRKAMEELKDAPIVFLFVSVDEDEENWRKAVEMDQLGGIHLRAQGLKAIQLKEYQLTGVPVSFYVNPEGVIAVSNPIQPMNGRMVQDWLKVIEVE